MGEVKILHTADLHIGAAESFLGPRAASRKAETLITFEKIVNTAKENGVDFLLIAGDLFDSNGIDLQSVKRVADCISSAPNVEVIYAAGNHDPFDVSSPLLKCDLPENLHILGTEDSVICFEDKKTKIFGRSFKEVYDKGKPEFSLKTDDEYINILCIHGELTTDKSSQYNPITPEYVLQSKMDYIALGHVHTATEIGKMGSTSFAYCGCPEGQGFDEYGDKGVYMGTVKKGEVNLQFVKTAFRTHIRENVDITGVSSSAEAYEKVISQIKEKYGESYFDNLYRITLTGEVGEDVIISADEISTRLIDTVYFAKTKDSTRLALDLELLKEEPSLKGIFVKTMLEKAEGADENEKALYDYALKLGLKAFSTEVTFDEN